MIFQGNSINATHRENVLTADTLYAIYDAMHAFETTPSVNWTTFCWRTSDGSQCRPQRSPLPWFFPGLLSLLH